MNNSFAPAFRLAKPKNVASQAECCIEQNHLHEK